ncbi:MAG TPA: hypothetical protein V6D10_07330 [Trichocoleus sp.]|jgi:ssDNA-binding Zn-finger/Zn-ribbon topoisomerase 1
MSDLSQLARQGDPQAIAALINQSFQPKGLTAQAVLKNNCLQLLIESVAPPNQRAVVGFIQKGLSSLQPKGIKLVKICGQQTGEVMPSWIEEIQLGVQLAPPVASSVQQSEPEEETIRCPRCKSTQIMVQKKGFSGGNAIVGAVLLGPVGLAGGFIGANDINLTCMKCAYQWNPNQPLPTVAPIPEVSPNPQPTKVKFKRMEFSERLGLGTAAAFVTGLILVFFSLFGAVFAAIIVFLGFLLGVDEWTSSLVGACPYCGKDVSVGLGKTKTQCLHCKHEFKVEANKRGGTFNPS